MDIKLTTTWRKSRHSDDKGGACVEVASFSDGVGLRDSKDPDGAKLVLDRGNFRALIDDLKRR